MSNKTASRTSYGNRLNSALPPIPYLDGNLAPAYDNEVEREHHVKKNNSGKSNDTPKAALTRNENIPQPVSLKAQLLNMAYVVVIAVAMVIICGSLISYVNLQADIISRVNHISAMEKELNTLKLANDETYTKIVSGVDLEEIKYIAITQMGMVYADEGQIVTYSGIDHDYCIQFSDIPD